MAVIKGMGTTLGMELETVSGAPALFVLYKRLGTGMDNGEVFSPARLVDLVIPQQEGADLVARVRRWIGEVSANQSIVPVARADFPLELTSSIVPSPEGINYEMKTGDLSVEIDWDKATDNVTIHAGAEFTLSFEGFIYYVDTLEDLIRAILLAKANG